MTVHVFGTGSTNDKYGCIFNQKYSGGVRKCHLSNVYLGILALLLAFVDGVVKSKDVASVDVLVISDLEVVLAVGVSSSKARRANIVLSGNLLVEYAVIASERN